MPKVVEGCRKVRRVPNSNGLVQCCTLEHGHKQGHVFGEPIHCDALPKQPTRARKPRAARTAPRIAWWDV